MKNLRIIDLSVLTEPSPSEWLPIEVTHEDHRQSMLAMKALLGCSEGIFRRD